MKVIRVIAIVFAVGAIGFSLLILGTGFFFGYSLFTTQRLKNQDFEFYGKVVSANGEPIRGVTLIAEYKCYRENFILWTAMDRLPTTSLEMESDSDGRFELTDVRGVNLQIFNFNHPRYEIAGERDFWGFSTSYASSRTEGLNFDDPFIIEMTAKPTKNRP